MAYSPAVLVATLSSGLISEPPIAWYHLVGPNLVVGAHGLAGAWLRRTSKFRSQRALAPQRSGTTG